MNRSGKRPVKPRVRAPLTADQEVLEQQAYYSEDDIAAVFDEFTPRADLDRREFTIRLEEAARCYVDWTAGVAADTTASPSIMQRRWSALGKRIAAAIAEPQKSGALQDELRGLDPAWRRELEYAVEDVAKRDRMLPDFEGDYIRLPAEGVIPFCQAIMPTRPDALADVAALGPRSLVVTPAGVAKTWPVARQIDKAIAELSPARLHWLKQCAERAAERAGCENTGRGKKPNEPLHTFVRLTIKLLRDSSAEPVGMPYTDHTTGERTGVMLDFLDVVLCPLRLSDYRTPKERYEELYGIIWRLPDLRSPPTLGRAALAKRHKHLS